MQLVFLLRCDIAAARASVQMQRRDECLWLVEIRSPAACPIAAAECAAELAPADLLTALESKHGGGGGADRASAAHGGGRARPAPRRRE